MLVVFIVQTFNFVSSDHSILCQLEFQWCLANFTGLVCFLCSGKVFFMQLFQRHCWYWGGALLFLRLSDLKMLPISAILELFMDSLTIFSTVASRLPGKFLTIPYGSKKHIIAFAVLSGMSICLCIFFVPIARLVTFNHHLSLLNWPFYGFSHGDGWQRDFARLLPHLCTLWKQEMMELHNLVLIYNNCMGVIILTPLMVRKKWNMRVNVLK